MRLIHRPAAEAALPEMSGALLARVYSSGIGTMHFGKRRTQCIDMIGHKHQVDMIGHQHPTPHRHAVRAAMPAKQFAVGGIVGLPEERPLPSVPSLGDVVRNTGQYVSRQSRHQRTMAQHPDNVNLVHCHRNPDHTGAPRKH